MANIDRKFQVLVNPTAGGGKAAKAAERVRDILEHRQVDFELVYTKDIVHAQEMASRAAQNGYVVVSLGGDGLFGAVAEAVSHVDGIAGLIPAGRGNDFARVAGVSKDLESACRSLLYSEVKEIDLGEANGKRFVGIASAGFDAVANQLANEVRWVKGNLAYAYGGIRTLVGWKPANFSVTADGIQWSFRGYSVSAANSKAYGGGMFLAPNAELTDGFFDLVTVREQSKLRFLTALPKVYKGTHIEMDAVTIKHARSVEVSADRPLKVYADGDQIAELPVELKTLPRALKVILP